MKAACSPGEEWTEPACVTAGAGSCEATRRKYTQLRYYACYDGYPVEISSRRKFVRCGC
ncbi:hypothetical protein [Amycolatopsis alba]|uniref:hypothetical protein n=1 Tax=Amycolatopsis alba TaxID=76020 RepID=UPI0003620F34|nr:hypothetical protein [Amycolatopsis alba]